MEASLPQPHTRLISEAPCELEVTDESQMKASHGSHCSSCKHRYIQVPLPAGAFQGQLSAVHGLLISKQDGVTDADVGQEIPDVEVMSQERWVPCERPEPTDSSVRWHQIMMQSLYFFSFIACLSVISNFSLQCLFSARAGNQLTAKLPGNECSSMEIGSIRRLKACTNMWYPAQEIHPGHSMTRLVPKIACGF